MRLVSLAGVPMSPWRGQLRELIASAARHARPLVAGIAGMWPLTATVLLAAALLWAAGFGGAP